MNMRVTASAVLLFSLGFSSSVVAEQALKGIWLRNAAEQALPDPQFSGLTWRHDELLAISDQSATEASRMKLFRIDPATGKERGDAVPITLSAEVRNGCFGDYLANSPDLEALTWDRLDDTTLITVTEDASRAQLSPACQRKFEQTNSTQYPTLLLKISVDAALTQAQITAVRPVQFPLDAKVGNQPNDGIEGLAIDDMQNLYLAIEKNLAGKPALFKTRLTQDFWAKDNFVKVISANLSLPPLDDRGHPINDLDFLPSPIPGHPGYLVAVARNDDQLWILDLTDRAEPFVQPLSFYVKTDTTGLCPLYERVVQTALEGVAVHGDQLYLVNDPWKLHYLDNIQCDINAGNFRQYSSLLFQMPIDPRWYTLTRPSAEQALPATSGMVRLDDKRYLLVFDKKIRQGGERLAVMQLAEQTPPTVQPLAIANWPNHQAANDLEAACQLPGRPNEVLLAESGTWQGEFGRLFHVKLEQNYATVLDTFLMPVTRDSNPEQEGDQFEGLACMALAPNRFQLIAAERGSATQPGSLQVGVLDLAASELTWQPERLPVSAPRIDPNQPEQRDIADLYLEGHILWAVAVKEASDIGPFQSMIYQVALVDPSQAEPLKLINNQQSYYRMDGYKIESLAAPSALIPGSSMSIASEDELFGGSWRALFAPSGQLPLVPTKAVMDTIVEAEPNATK